MTHRPLYAEAPERARLSRSHSEGYSSHPTDLHCPFRYLQPVARGQIPCCLQDPAIPDDPILTVPPDSIRHCLQAIAIQRWSSSNSEKLRACKYEETQSSNHRCAKTWSHCRTTLVSVSMAGLWRGREIRTRPSNSAKGTGDGCTPQRVPAQQPDGGIGRGIYFNSNILFVAEKLPACIRYR